jgi:hypothetical protein
MDFLTFLGFSGIILSLLAATAKAVVSAPSTFLDAAQRDGRFAEPASPLVARRAEPATNDAPGLAA